MQVNIHDAKTRLSKLIEAAERGEEVVIARAGKPVVRLTLVEPPLNPKDCPSGDPRWPNRVPGMLKGKISYSEDWDSDEVNAEIARLFNGSDDEFTDDLKR